MVWCLIKEHADRARKALESGEIKAKELIDMTSEERKKFLGRFVGEANAKDVNTLFESKLLLKHQREGLTTWAETLSGLRGKSKTDILDKIKKLDRALNPKEQEKFLSDIVERRLGVGITEKEAKTITELSQKAEKLFDPKLENWQQSKDYWKTKQQLVKFLREAVPEVSALSKMGKFKQIRNVASSLWRSYKTGYDVSFPLRQGAAYTGTRQWRGAFKRMFEYAKSPLAMDDLEVKMMSNKYSEQALKYKKQLGLTMLGEKMTQREEQFASKISEKIPLLAGSERAYVGFANDLRFNRFVDILGELDKAGKGITDNPEMMENLAKSIGASTGRGTLGKYEPAADAFATALFSPRMYAGRLQTIINPFRFKGAARKEAILSLARLVGVSVSALGLAKMSGSKIELDPRSSDFGKIKRGNTRYDTTGGMGAFITLFSRLGTMSTKSASTGEITKLNQPGYMKKTAFDVATDFVTGKSSPAARIVIDVLKGKDFDGNRINLNDKKALATYLANQLFMPLIASDVYDAYKNGSGGVDLIAATVGSMFGVGVQTYKPQQMDWNQSSSKEMSQFKDKVGQDKFNEANQKYNDKVDKKLNDIRAKEDYKKMSQTDKDKVISAAKEKVKGDIFIEYGFKYRYQPPDKSKQNKIRSIIK